MLSVVWSGASTASDVLLLLGAILAGLVAVLRGLVRPPDAAGALLAAAVCLVALGLLAI